MVSRNSWKISGILQENCCEVTCVKYPQDLICFVHQDLVSFVH